MKFFRGTVLSLATVLLASCSGGDGGKDEAIDPVPDQNITLESIGIDWDSSGHLPDVDPPDVPAGMTAGVYDELVRTLREWATASTVRRDVWESDDPLAGVVGAVSNQNLAELLDKVLSESGEVDSRLWAANVISPDVTVMGDPAVVVRWSVGPTTTSEGHPAIEVQLQTTAAYQIELEDRTQRVIGMIRSHWFRMRKDTTGKVSTGVRWEEYAAEDCALKTEDRLRPDTDINRAKEDLNTLVEIGGSDEVHEFDEDESDDFGSDEYDEKCADDAA